MLAAANYPEREWRSTGEIGRSFRAAIVASDNG
jgi:hypothetical protein